MERWTLRQGRSQSLSADFPTLPAVSTWGQVSGQRFEGLVQKVIGLTCGPTAGPGEAQRGTWPQSFRAALYVPPLSAIKAGLNIQK